MDARELGAVSKVLGYQQSKRDVVVSISLFFYPALISFSKIDEVLFEILDQKWNTIHYSYCFFFFYSSMVSSIDGIGQLDFH